MAELIIPPLPPAIWKVGQRDSAAELHLLKELGIPSLVAAVLASRGMADPRNAESFLNPRLEDLHDPRLLPDYDAAVREIMGAKERGETIYVHGDYDTDGVTSTAIFTRFLRRIGCQVIPHVPHRMKEGYGIHQMAVQWAKDHGASLFLTCDCGISAHDQLDLVKAAGMRAVVTDHHELKETLPEACAVVNPHRKDTDYPFQTLCGAGIVYKLCLGIARELGHQDSHFHRAFLDLAVLGTVADVMPLVDENRIITRHGLPLLKESKKPGIRALLAAANLDRHEGPLTSRHIGFQLAPRINAAGRIDDADISLTMMLTEDMEEATSIAQRLNEINQERRDETQRMQNEAISLILEREMNLSAALIIENRGWHPGMVGLVASRLVETFHRPSFVISLNDQGIGRGSARSIPGFHLAEALDDAWDHLLGGGGHAMAAGFSLESKSVDAFREAVQQRAAEILSEEDLTPKRWIDSEITPGEATAADTEALAALEPFGEANPAPYFLARKAVIVGHSPTRSPEHARLTIQHGHLQTPGFIFRKGQEAEELLGQEVDLVFQPEFNLFQGRSDFRWRVEDLRLSSPS